MMSFLSVRKTASVPPAEKNEKAPIHLVQEGQGSDIVRLGEIPEQTLAAIARRDESLRDHFAMIVRKSNEVVALRDEVIATADQVGKALGEYEATHATLVERNALVLRLEQANAELEAAASASREATSALRNNNCALQSQIDHFNALVRNRESRIEHLEADLLRANGRICDLEAELDGARGRNAASREEYAAAIAQLAKMDALVETMQSEAVALTGQCNVLTFRLEAAHASLAEAQSESKTAREKLATCEREREELERRLAKTQLEQSNAWKRVEMLEASLMALQIEHDRTRGEAQQSFESQTRDIHTLQEGLDEARAKASALDKFIEDAQGELRARIGELRVAERRAEQAESRLAGVEDRARAATEELARANETNAALERSRAHLANRAQALVRAMKDQRAQIEVANERRRALEQRHAEETTESAADSAALRTTIQELTEQIDKERLARQLAVEALGVARLQTLASITEPLAALPFAEATPLPPALDVAPAPGQPALSPGEATPTEQSSGEEPGDCREELRKYPVLVGGAVYGPGPRGAGRKKVRRDRSPAVQPA